MSLENSVLDRIHQLSEEMREAIERKKKKLFYTSYRDLSKRTKAIFVSQGSYNLNMGKEFLIFQDNILLNFFEQKTGSKKKKL